MTIIVLMGVAGLLLGSAGVSNIRTREFWMGQAALACAFLAGMNNGL